MERKTNYHTHITSSRRWLDVDLKEIWRYRDLIFLFTRRSFVVRYTQTILGPVWIFLHPLISALIYGFVFGEIAGIGTEGVPRILFYLWGNALWSFFAGCITKNANTFTANAAVFGKVYFPRLTVPISNMLSEGIRLGVQMLLVLPLLGFFLLQGQVRPNWAYWPLIPFLLLHLGVLGLGVGILVSSLTTKYRDLSVLVEFGVQLWMYASPIAYPLSQVGEGWMKAIVRLNPVTAPVELLRCALLGRGTVDWGGYCLSLLVTLAVAAVGVVIFNRVEKTFMDTV